MAYQRVNFPITYHKPNALKKGEAYEGVYLGQGEDNFGNPTYKFKNSEEGKLHVFNHCGSLSKLISEYVEDGDWCRLTYKGQSPITFGKFKGKSFHDFDLDIDPERSVETAATVPTDEGSTQDVPSSPATVQEETL